MRLYIDSGTHVDNDLHERIDRIENTLGEPEVVFNEGDSSPFSFEAIGTLKTFPFAPLMIAAFAIQIYAVIEFFGRVVSYLGGESSGRDQEVVQELKNTHEIESREVDLDLSKHIQENKLTNSVVNWTALVFLFVLFWPSYITWKSVLLLLAHELLAGYVLVLVFLALVHDERNQHFASIIADSKKDFQTACLVTGGTHHAGTAQFLEDEPGITVLNPEPESLSIFSRIVVRLFSFIHRIRSALSSNTPPATFLPDRIWSVAESQIYSLRLSSLELTPTPARLRPLG